ncbi:MAG: hypothetical protein LIP23_03020 [Planctomycetes bacterium]|nr:hypothetical protein [Planctomycetota bacterium]
MTPDKDDVEKMEPEEVEGVPVSRAEANKLGLLDLTPPSPQAKPFDGKETTIDLPAPTASEPATRSDADSTAPRQTGRSESKISTTGGTGRNTRIIRSGWKYWARLLVSLVFSLVIIACLIVAMIALVERYYPDYSESLIGQLFGAGEPAPSEEPDTANDETDPADSGNPTNSEIPSEIEQEAEKFGVGQRRDEINLSFQSTDLWTAISAHDAPFLIHDDFDGDGAAELAAVYWSGTQGVIAILTPTGTGGYQQIAETVFPGKPAHAGASTVGGGKKLAVLDEFSQSLRLFSYANTVVAQTDSIDPLSDKPLLCDFNGDKIAILRKTDAGLETLVLRRYHQETLITDRWQVPDTVVWQDLFIINNGTGTAVALVGINLSEGLLFMQPDREPEWTGPAAPGAIRIAAARDVDGKSVAAIVQYGSQFRLLRWLGRSDGGFSVLNQIVGTNLLQPAPGASGMAVRNNPDQSQFVVALDTRHGFIFSIDEHSRYDDAPLDQRIDPPSLYKGSVVFNRQHDSGKPAFIYVNDQNGVTAALPGSIGMTDQPANDVGDVRDESGLLQQAFATLADAVADMDDNTWHNLGAMLNALPEPVAIQALRYAGQSQWSAGLEEFYALAMQSDSDSVQNFAEQVIRFYHPNEAGVFFAKLR